MLTGGANFNYRDTLTGYVEEILTKRDAILASRALNPYAVARIMGKPVRWPAREKSVLPAPAEQPKPETIPRAIPEPVGVHLAKMVTPDDPLVPVGKIMRAVSKAAGIDLNQLRGPWRDRRFSWPRQVAMLMLYELRPDLSSGQIAFLLGDLDHTSVLHGVKRARERVHFGPSRSQVWYCAAKLALEAMK